MGLVLAFQTSPRPSASRTGAAQRRRVEPSRSAEILFFTGVRYERHIDASAHGAAVAAASTGQELPAS